MMLDGIAGAANAGGGAAGRVVDDDLGGDGMQCSNHPYKNSASAGGICAFCLQEKLGNLVYSSSSSFIGGSSSPSPSFRSDPSAAAASNAASAAGVTVSSSSSTNGYSYANKTTRRARIPFLLTQKEKKKVTADSHHSNYLVLKRSKSTATNRRRDENPCLPSEGEDDFNNPQKRWGFWSFLYPAKPKSEKPTISDSSSARDLKPPAQAASTSAPVSKEEEDLVVAEKSTDIGSSSSSNATSFGRKVSRSRSVGCGSRRISGDFGECALRRVESQRGSSAVRCGAGDVVEGRVRCGGIFSGLMMTSLSSSASSYSAAGEEHRMREKGSTAAGPVVYGRSKSWGWALASPMRVFGKPPSSSTKDMKTESKSNGPPDLAAIPSLLTANG